mgnify:CR=1 FL=1
MDDLFNKKSLEQLIKKWISEVIEEKLIPKVSPSLQDKEKGDQPKKLVKLKEASEFTGFEKKYIYNLVSQKAIPFIRIRNSLRFDLDELDAWMRAGRPKIVDLGMKKLKEDIEP